MSKQKTIAMVDFDWDGHHSTYFKIFTKILLELGYQVMAFCPDPTDLQVWIGSNSAEQSALLYTFKSQRPKQNLFLTRRQGIGLRLRRALSKTLVLQHTVANIKQASLKTGISPDLVFFPWLDEYMCHNLTHHLVDLVVPYNWSGLYHHPRHLRIKKRFSYLRRGFFNPHAILESSNCRGVAVLDEGIAEQLQNQLRGKPVIVFPNFTDESPPATDCLMAQQIKKKANGKKIISLLGSLEKRKGLLTLLEASQKMIEEDYFFVFAGKLAESSFLPQELIKIRGICELAPDNCFFHWERIPDESQFNALVAQSDALFVVYENFPIVSNILTKAVLFEKPVIASNTFWIGETVNKYQLGLTIPEGDILKCIEAIHHLFNQSQLDTCQLQPKFEGYRILNSTKQLVTQFKAVLSSCLANQ